MKEIANDHQNFRMPRYCFTKKFKTYYFFVGKFTLSYSELFLDFLEDIKDNFKITSYHWEMYAPEEGIIIFKEPDEKDVAVFFDEIKIIGPFREIKSTFQKFLLRYGQPLTVYYRLFWVQFQDKIQVYVDDDQDIVIIGIDLQSDRVRLNPNKKAFVFDSFAYEGGFAEYSAYIKSVLKLSDVEIEKLNQLFVNEE